MSDQGATGTETQTTRLSPTYTIPEGETLRCWKSKSILFTLHYHTKKKTHETQCTQVYAHPYHASALARVYEETTRLAASEPGVIYYSISREPADADAGGSGKEGGGGGGGGKVKGLLLF